MKILFTAFKGVQNTSFQLVSQMGAETVLLTNSFQGLEKDISSIRGDDRIVYMFGADKTLADQVRIETCANYNGEMINTDFDILQLEEKLKESEISYTVSDKPARYLCNAAYYHMLKKNPNAVFIHIPSFRGMSMEMMNRLIKTFADIHIK